LKMVPFDRPYATATLYWPAIVTIATNNKRVKQKGWTEEQQLTLKRTRT